MQFYKILAMLWSLGLKLNIARLDKFFLHPFCISMYHSENSAVTALGSKLLRGSLQNVDGLENNNSVTYQSNSELTCSCSLQSFETEFFSLFLFKMSPCIISKIDT